MREIRIPGIRRALRISFSKRTVRREVDDEIHFHLDARTAELMRLGIPEHEARERAEAEYGDVHDSERELVSVDRRRLGYEHRNATLMSFIDDIRYAARGLMRRPALLIVTTMMLSLGIAANAIMFGIVDQLLIRPPAHVAAPDQVKRIYFAERFDGGEVTAYAVTTYPLIAALREHVAGFSEVAAFAYPQDHTLGRGSDARSVKLQLVSGNWFNLLGVVTPIGRGLTPQDDRVPVGEAVAVASHGFWQRELGSAPDAVGHTVSVDGTPYSIVGVAPEGFHGIGRMNVDLWIPVSAMAADFVGDDWHNTSDSYWISAIGRLRDGSTAEQVAEQATTTFRSVVNSWNEAQRDSTGAVLLGSIVGTRTPDGMSDEGRVSLWLMGVSAIVLLVACANVANLLIARTVQRRREIAVRLALGVSRGRLVRMLLTEAGLLAALGMIVALALATVASRLVQQLLLPGMVWSDSVLDMRVLGFTTLAALACIVLAGVAPALHGIGTRASEGLKASSGRIAGGGGRLRFTLMVLQAALSIMLLIGAGLFVSSLRHVTGRDVGIDLERVLRVTMPLSRFGFDTARATEVYRQATENLRALPGVTSVAEARQTTPMGSATSMAVFRPGMTEPLDIPGGGPYGAVVTGEFFTTIGARVLRGRAFTSAEERTPARVVIVNDMLARHYWPNEDPLGDCVRIGRDETCSEVVGVVENVLQFRLVGDDRALAYVPPSHPALSSTRAPSLLVRTAGDPTALIGAIRDAVQRISPNMPFVSVRPYTDLVSAQLRPWRLGAAMFTLFGGIALIMAAVGLYSVMAYWVSQRTHEIGVRMALGARQGDVVRLVAWQSTRAIALGLLLGGLAAAFASRWVADMLYETSPREPVIYGLAALVLALASVVASVLPARRSAAVDPALALRSE